MNLDRHPEIVTTANAHDLADSRPIETDAVIVGAGPPGRPMRRAVPGKPIYDIPTIAICTGG